MVSCGWFIIMITTTIIMMMMMVGGGGGVDRGGGSVHFCHCTITKTITMWWRGAHAKRIQDDCRLVVMCR